MTFTKMFHLKLPKKYNENNTKNGDILVLSIWAASKSCYKIDNWRIMKFATGSMVMQENP
jgi:hypothetical protein